ncbi:MAG: phytanoyl-CoA dioxygenase family protein [Halioglobus sp.]
MQRNAPRTKGNSAITTEAASAAAQGSDLGEANLPYIESSIDEPAEVLRARFQEHGYLFLRRFLPQEQCSQMLNALLEAASPHVTAGDGTESGSPQLSGEPFSETDPIWDEVYPKIQALESFHNIFHRAPLVDLMGVVTNKPVFVYPMKMARISTPRKLGYETPPHQDAHSHQAGPTMAGIWVALHDIRSDMGRVKVLPKSHLRGVRPVHQTQGVGGVACEIYPEETTWHVSDYSAGDVLIFHSCTVHKAEPNSSESDVRMSIDTRFCDFGARVFSTNLEPHHGWRIDCLDWDYIYQDWQDNSLKYYWKDYPALF